MATSGRQYGRAELGLRRQQLSLPQPFPLPHLSLSFARSLSLTLIRKRVLPGLVRFASHPDHGRRRRRRARARTHTHTQNYFTSKAPLGRVQTEALEKR